MRLGQKRKYAGIFFVVLLVTMVIFAYFTAERPPERWDSATQNETAQLGSTLVQGIYAYKDDHGVYPESLSLLVPTYIDEIKPPTIGERKWSYWGYEGSFILQVNSRPQRFELLRLITGTGFKFEPQQFSYSPYREGTGWAVRR